MDTRLHHRGLTRIGLAVLAVGIGLALSSGAAQAWFAAVASGSGAAPVGALQDLTATAAPVSAALLPGASADLVVELANPNGVAVRVDSIAVDPTRGTGGVSVDRAGCPASAIALAAQTTGWIVPARTGGADGRLSVRLPGALALATDAPDACQGASFTVHLRAS